MAGAAPIIVPMISQCFEFLQLFGRQHVLEFRLHFIPASLASFKYLLAGRPRAGFSCLRTRSSCVFPVLLQDSFHFDLLAVV